MLRKITLLILTTLVLSVGYKWYEKSQWIETSQIISKRGYKLSVKFNKNDWNDKKGEGEYSLGYTAGIHLENKKDKNIYIYIDFSYELQNNGDDTPHEVGDTGGRLWPPQEDELTFPFNDEEYTKIGTFLGKELYVTKPNDYGSVAVVQKLKSGKVTGVMPLLNKDQDRVNYYESFSISAELGEDKRRLKKRYHEFLKILKTMKIEKIFDTTKTTRE